MKTFRYIYSIVGVALLALCMQSCFQDLGQDIPFDYPEQPEVNVYEGQFAYFSFNADYNDEAGDIKATVTGTPSRVAGKEGSAYKGAVDSYLSIPTTGFTTAFSACFWYKLNATPDRAGILTAGVKDNRSFGIRLFREGSAEKQIIKGNIGDGTADSWLDGGDAAAITDGGASWVFIALSLSPSGSALYINGKEVSKNPAVVSWTNCPTMSIGSGQPSFVEWNHLYDGSLIDELRLFNKTLSSLDVMAIFEKEAN